MKVNISISGEITPEEIFSIGKLIEDKIAKEVVREFIHIPKESWAGKTVLIKSTTPDSEITSWNHDMKRGVEYGVTEDSGGVIKIGRQWLPKVWFGIVN